MFDIKKYLLILKKIFVILFMKLSEEERREYKAWRKGKMKL